MDVINTLVNFYQTRRRHTPEDILRSHKRVNRYLCLISRNFDMMTRENLPCKIATVIRRLINMKNPPSLGPI